MRQHRHEFASSVQKTVHGNGPDPCYIEADNKTILQNRLLVRLYKNGKSVPNKATIVSSGDTLRENPPPLPLSGPPAAAASLRKSSGGE